MGSGNKNKQQKWETQAWGGRYGHAGGKAQGMYNKAWAHCCSTCQHTTNSTLFMRGDRKCVWHTPGFLQVPVLNPASPPSSTIHVCHKNYANAHTRPYPVTEEREDAGRKRYKRTEE